MTTYGICPRNADATLIDGDEPAALHGNEGQTVTQYDDI